MEALFRLEFRTLWRAFWKEHFSFWMICGYLTIEYVRPQAIMPQLDVLPWGKLFLILSMVGWLADPKKKRVRDRANVLLTLFLFVLIAASLLAAYPEDSLEHWFDFFGWYLIYFLIINIVTTEKRFFIFLLIFILASFKLSLFGARTWAMRGFTFTSWGLVGPPGPFQNSGEFSIQMLMFGPIAYQLALFLKPWLTRTKYWLLMLMPLTAIMTVIGASSRGSQLALLYQFYRLQIKRNFSFKRLALAATVVAIGLAFLPDEQWARFTAVGNDRTSTQRLLYWKGGLEMIKEHPALGIGFYNFPHYFAVHYPEDVLYEQAQLPHNIFIQVGTDAGLIGLAVFVALLFRNISCAREIEQRALARNGELGFQGNVARGLQIAAWGFILAGQFVTVAYYPFLWINLAMTVALLNISKLEGNSDPPAVSPPPSSQAPA